jgi:ubiquinone/menaquinone biosynthesis C-methylase UbiE
MNIYSRFIFPRLIDRVMSGDDFVIYRRELLQDAVGEVLEIGFGTGLNLPYYPVDRVQQVTSIEVNPGMKKIADRRIAASQIRVNFQILNGENLLMENDIFDTVVSTWTLCSIRHVEQSIAEIYRVLKPGGKFIFIEHGLSNEPNIQTWQHRLNPVQKIIADGCHLDREIKALIAHQFTNLSVKEFYAPDKPKIGSYFYQGIAIK